FQVATGTNVGGPRASVANDGNFVIVWDCGDPGSYPDPPLPVICGRRYSPTGAAFDPGGPIEYGIQNPDAAVGNGGHFVVVWYSPGDQDVKGRRSSGVDGTPFEAAFRMNTHTTGSQSSPR